VVDDLGYLRQRIDVIDDKIISLLRQRIEIVKKVKQLKNKDNSTLNLIRAGREASMLRNLVKKGGGDMPPEAIATIWRMIISSSLCVEQDMSIAAYVFEGDYTCYWRAREYYGSFVDLVSCESADDVIGRVVKGESSIGILPLVDVSEVPWWVRPVEEKNEIYVFARIPFIAQEDSEIAHVLAVANVATEPTDDDVSIIAVRSERGDEILVQAAFERVGFRTTWLAKKGDDFLIEVDDYLVASDPRLETVRVAFGNGGMLRLLGSYAAPVVI